MDYKLLEDQCDFCFNQPGWTHDPIVVGGYVIQLRYSQPLWTAENGMRYNTLDVVTVKGVLIETGGLLCFILQSSVESYSSI